MFKTFLSNSLDILYPPECHFCSEPLHGGQCLCDACADELQRVEPPFCDACGEPYDGLIVESFECPNCSDIEMAFDFGIAAVRNTHQARELVHALKYMRQRHLSREMARMMATVVREDKRFHGKEWVIVPTPLHWIRMMRRGYNQSQDLALHLAKLTGFPINPCLVRKARTPTQTRLNRKQRMHNLDGCFCVKYRGEVPKPLNVILVDDVLTTGSTAHESALTLRAELEVESIAVLTFLRG